MNKIFLILNKILLILILIFLSQYAYAGKTLRGHVGITIINMPPVIKDIFIDQKIELLMTFGDYCDKLLSCNFILRNRTKDACVL